MVTLVKVFAVLASFIVWSLLTGCGVDSDVGVDQEAASTPEVPEQNARARARAQGGDCRC